MQALTPIAVIPHQHHLILQIIELNLQTGSVVLRVWERSGRVLYIYRDSNSFDPVVTRGINMGHETRYMLYDGHELFYTPYLW
jgi:hypothetical protein